MCCRLRLNTKELRKRGGGLFGSNPLTGSIGVFTINLPRIGYLSSTESEFKARLWRMACIGKTSLEIKRKILEQQSEAGLYPFSACFLKDVKQRTGQYWFNHFSTIGIIGMNEALLNFMGKDITTDEGQKFAIRMIEYLRDILVEFQEETGHVYNLEATPAEATSYRLALADKSRYADIITAGSDIPYYTNSTQVPVRFTDNINSSIDLLMYGSVYYEFRTTFIPRLKEDDILTIANRIKGSKLYVLQQFRNIDKDDESYCKYNEEKPHSKEYIRKVIRKLNGLVKLCYARGL